MLCTRPPGAGSNTPATSATPVCLAAAASPEQNGPSSGSAAARRSEPNLTWVASGNTARSAPLVGGLRQGVPDPAGVDLGP